MCLIQLEMHPSAKKAWNKITGRDSEEKSTTAIRWIHVPGIRDLSRNRARKVESLNLVLNLGVHVQRFNLESGWTTRRTLLYNAHVRGLRAGFQHYLKPLLATPASRRLLCIFVSAELPSMAQIPVIFCNHFLARKLQASRKYARLPAHVLPFS
jgi:hypothetical protein